MVFCSNIDGLMAALKIDYKSDERRPFIDSSKLCLKAGLLHNTNLFPSVPIGYAVYMKETYENMKKLLCTVNCDKFKWHISGDLKVIAIFYRLYQILLLFVFMGQPNKGTSLQIEGLACLSITSTWNTQCFI